MESKTNKKVTTYCTKRNIIRKRIERLSVPNALRATAGKERWHFICEYRLTVKDRNIRIDIDNIQSMLFQQ